MRDLGLVKTQKFGDAKYVGDPLNTIKIFNEKNVDELMFLDIDASAKRSPPNFEFLKRLASESRMPVCYGGGISSAKEAAQTIALGFEKVSISSAAVNRPDLIREVADAVGSQSVVVTVDVRKNGVLPGYSIFTRNGRDRSEVNLIEFCQQVEALGAGEVVINSIDRDGEMKGYDLVLAMSVRHVIASPMSVLGGAGSPQDMQALIDAVGVVGAAAGSMFVFKGVYRAVLISYSRPERLN